MTEARTVQSLGRSEATNGSELRLCYLVESFYPIIGGMEAQAQLAVEQFVKQSVDVTVLTRHIVMTSKRRENFFGASVFRIPPSGGTSGAMRWPMLITALVWLIKERKNFDAIFVSGFRALGMAAVLAGKLAGKKVVLKPDNIGELSGAFFDGRLKKLGLSHSNWAIRSIIALRNNVLKRADVFCPNTTDTEKEFLNAGIERDRIHLIHNSYNNSRFVPVSSEEKRKLRRKFSIGENRIVAIFTGRLDSVKGPQHLVRMWHQIAKTNNHPLLLVVGPDSYGIFNCGDEIRAYIGAHNLESDIVMTGGVRNVEEYLSASDFYCFPTQGGETLTTAVIEAMACGLPVITTRSTGVIDLVTPETGLVVEPTDFEGFKAAIVKMLTDEHLRKSLGRAAADRARRLFSPETVYCRYVQIFRTLLGQKDPQAI